MHLSLPKWFPLFILSSSVCKSLQCLISTLTQGCKGGHLFRLTCSVVLWGGRNTADKSHWHVWGVLAVSQPHCICPCSWHVLSQSTLLRLQVALQGNCLKWALGCMHFPCLSCSGLGSWVLHKGTDSVGPTFCALPRSKQLRRQVIGERTLPRSGASVPATRFPGCAAGAPSQVCCVSLLGS